MADPHSVPDTRLKSLISEFRWIAHQAGIEARFSPEMQVVLDAKAQSFTVAADSLDWLLGESQMVDSLRSRLERLLIEYRQRHHDLHIAFRYAECGVYWRIIHDLERALSEIEERADA